MSGRDQEEALKKAADKFKISKDKIMLTQGN